MEIHLGTAGKSLNRYMEIRKATEGDKADIWTIIQHVISGGDTYTFAPDTSEDEIMAFWFSPEKHNYVAEIDGIIVGIFWLKANQPGLGSHVGNAAYMVSPDAKRQGVGKAMAEYSLEEAKRLGFTAMQFNFVVKTNAVAVKLWQSVGFDIIGEIPDAIRHSSNGLTNAYIMYRKL